MRATLKNGARHAVLGVLRQPAARNVVMRRAAAQGRALVLCYHRIAPHSGGDHVMTPMPPERFAEQMQALLRVGDIVPVAALLAGATRYDRPAFAITFDDDDVCHVKFALPVLRALRIPATFFLSGRALSGCAAYWWALLERSVAEVGLEATCRRLGHQASSVKALARICRTAGSVRELTTREAPAVMQGGDFRALADAGMTIGFHTLRHEVLPQLDDNALAHALSEGRDALESATGQRLDLLAYPYGRADARVAKAAGVAEYEAAFTTDEHAVAAGADRLLLGRWQPSSMPVDHFLAEAALRLARPVVSGR